jgi:putative thioredoxin
VAKKTPLQLCHSATLQPCNLATFYNEETNMSNVFESSQATFQQDVIQRSHQTPVLVDFWAPWCGPCRMLGPVLERMANEPNSGFVLAKINSDHNQQLAMQYGVRGIPNVKAFVNGRLVDEFVGAQPEPMVRQFVQRLPKASGGGQAKSSSRPSANGRPSMSIADDPATRLQQGRSLLAQGKGCEALPVLDNFPASPEADAAQRLRPLAQYLCAAAQGKLGSASDLDNTYRQAADAIRRRDYSTGLYQLLTVVNQDKSYRGGEPKNVMLGLFELMGDADPLTQAYRQQLASAIF